MAQLGRGNKIGLLGGSFNPAHEGHLYISRKALELLGLDEVWWLVSPQNPLKDNAEMAPFAERVEYATRLALSDPNIKISDFEYRLVNKAMDKPVDNSVGNYVHNSVEKPVSKDVDSSVDSSVDKSVRNSVGNAVSNSVHKAVDNFGSKPVDNSVDNHVSSLVDNSVDCIVGSAVDKAVGKSVDKCVDKSVGCGSGRAYTCDTILAIQAAFPDNKFVWLMGADNLIQFHKWHQWREIMNLLPVAVFNRGGIDKEAALSSEAAHEFAANRLDDAMQLITTAPPVWAFLGIEKHPLSSTHLRGESVVKNK
jgi:nicotinic acid mononucleotide adenylyltransferase